jgi:hypothetical protein
MRLEIEELIPGKHDQGIKFMAHLLLTGCDPEHPSAISKISRHKLTYTALFAVDESTRYFVAMKYAPSLSHIAQSDFKKV